LTRIGVVGFYGHSNSGDEAMAAVCLTELSQRIHNSMIFVPCRPLVMPRELDVCWQPLARPWKRPLQRERRLCKGRCDALVFGGGSVFSDLKGIDSLELRYRRVSGFRKRGTRVAAIGVSIGPLMTPKGRAIAKSLLEQFEIVVVRDIESMRVATELGLANAVQGFDVAVLLDEIGLPEPPRSTPQHKEKRTLGLAICNYSQYVGRGYKPDLARLNKIETALHSTDWTGWRLSLLALGGHPRAGDLFIASHLQNSLRKTVECEVVAHHPNPLLMLRRVGSCDAFVSMRLHGAVYAFTAERPFGILTYHPKCAGFAEMVRLPKELLLDSETFTPQDLHRLLACLMAEPAKPSALLPLAEAKGLARLGLERVAEAVPGERQ